MTDDISFRLLCIIIFLQHHNHFLLWGLFFYHIYSLEVYTWNMTKHGNLKAWILLQGPEFGSICTEIFLELFISLSVSNWLCSNHVFIQKVHRCHLLPGLLYCHLLIFGLGNNRWVRFSRFFQVCGAASPITFWHSIVTFTQLLKYEQLLMMQR